MSRLITEVKVFGKSALLKLIFVLVFSIFLSSPINVMAEEVPYWAGHETEMWGQKSNFRLSIRYSKDGKSYSADIFYDFTNKYGYYRCEGKIDKKGNLEEQDCNPLGYKKRILKGHVTKVVYENVTKVVYENVGAAGGAGGDVFVDDVLLERKTGGQKPRVVEVEKPLAKVTRLAAEAKQSAEAARIEATQLAAEAEQAEAARIEATRFAAETQQAQRVAEAKPKQVAEQKAKQ